MKNTLMKFWKDESGQGTAEYVLVLAAVAAIGMAFKTRITKWMGEATEKATLSLDKTMQSGE